MSASAILRAILLLALLGLAILVATGVLSRIGGKTAGAVRAAV